MIHPIPAAAIPLLKHIVACTVDAACSGIVTDSSISKSAVKIVAEVKIIYMMKNSAAYPKKVFLHKDSRNIQDEPRNISSSQNPCGVLQYLSY